MEITDQCSENSETLDIGKRVWGSRISIPCVSYVDARNRDPWATLKLEKKYFSYKENGSVKIADRIQITEQR